VLEWLSVWSEVQICLWPSWCHCHSLSLAPVNTDWFCLYKEPLNRRCGCFICSDASRLLFVDHIDPLSLLACTPCIMISVQELKRTSIEKLESLLQDTKKTRAVNKLEYSLLIKYCASGVGVLVVDWVFMKLLEIGVLWTCVYEQLMQFSNLHADWWIINR